MFAIAGAQEGVGATTIAVNLAVALARQGQRVVLVDADFTRPEIASLCGLKPRYTTGDVLSGRREIHEVLLAGPASVQVLPGTQAMPLGQPPVVPQRVEHYIRVLRKRRAPAQ